jgi:hypothetical protein
MSRTAAALTKDTETRTTETRATDSESQSDSLFSLNHTFLETEEAFVLHPQTDEHSSEPHYSQGQTKNWP